MSQQTFSISRKLVFFVVIVSVLAIIVTAFLSFNSAEKILKENTQSMLSGEASLRGASLVNLLNTRINDIEILAKNPQLYSLIQDLNESELNGIIDSSLIKSKRNEFLKIINDYQKMIGYSIYLEDVVVIGKSRDVFFSLVDIQLTDDSYFQMIPKKITKPMMKFEILDNNTRKLVILYPVWVDTLNKDIENSDGIIIAKMRTTDIDEILLNRSGLGKTGEVYLVNENHVLISESRFIDDAAFNYDVDTVPVIKCFSNHQSIDGGTYDDYRGISIFGASYCRSDLGFVLIAEIDESETFEPIDFLQKEIFFVGIVVTTVIGGTAFILANLISRPLKKLTNAVNEVAKGNFDVRTNIRTKDEIGHLSLAFDSMTKKMQDALISIKQRDDVIRQQEEELLSFSGSDHSYCVGFIDIVNSTKITSTLSDSDTDKFYSLFLNSMASIITNFEGLVVKNMGDALLFYFPKTTTPENIVSFKNVIDCCISMVDFHEGINQKMIQEGLPKLDYRISLAYGSVRIAKVITSSIEDIFGSTVNKCSKINRLAQPNGLVIGNNLYHIIKSLNKEYDFKKIGSDEMMENYGYEAVYFVSKKSSKQ